ncbi:MAG: phosphatase PAP2 family protein [Odoribacteraceae bacterium]|jgi:undecaprenyl-diphosphatase|nr:phosphatase PAP2 family protein [Odoribacteraceae bacterium]
MWDLLQEWDKSLFLVINGIHGPYGDHFVGLFAAKMTWGIMYATILFVLCKNFNWRGVLVAALAFVLLIVLSDQLASTLLRPLFARPRPSRAEDLEGLVHLIGGRRGGAFGFPSAHAANTAALATFIILFFRRRSLALFFIAWTLATCHARVYAGVHYPGDVLAGILVGVFSGLTIHAAYRLLVSRLPVLAPRGKITRAPFVPLVPLVGLLTVAVIALYSLFPS